MFTGLNFANTAVDRAVYHSLRLNNSKVENLHHLHSLFISAMLTFTLMHQIEEMNETLEPIKREYIVLDQIF